MAEKYNDTIIYDGDCRICRSSINIVRARIHGNNTDIIPYQKLDEKLGDIDISQETYTKSVVYIVDGKAYTGAEAVAGIFKQMTFIWRIAGYIISFPGIKQITNWCYYLFARNRDFFAKIIYR